MHMFLMCIRLIKGIISLSKCVIIVINVSYLVLVGNLKMCLLLA